MQHDDDAALLQNMFAPPDTSKDLLKVYAEHFTGGRIAQGLHGPPNLQEDPKFLTWRLPYCSGCSLYPNFARLFKSSQPCDLLNFCDFIVAGSNWR